MKTSKLPLLGVVFHYTLVTFHVCFRLSSAEEIFSKIVYPDKDGKLVYMPDQKGNVIPDFSHCGYMGGGVALPDISVIMTVEPRKSGDDTDRLQAKIDAISKWPINANGFRGALLFKSGMYRISRALQVKASGIVLRGEGDGEDGTVFFATGKEKTTLINFSGRGRRPREVDGTRQKIMDDYVSVGERKQALVGRQWDGGETLQKHNQRERGHKRD